MSARSIRRSLTATAAVAMSLSFSGCDLLDYFTCIQFGSCGQAGPIVPQEDPTNRDTTPPEPPTGVTAVAGDGQVTLNWTPSVSADVTEYYIEYVTEPGGQVTNAGDATGRETTSRVVDRLTNGTPYYFRLAAMDAAGNLSPRTAEVAATPASGATAGRSPLLQWGRLGEGDGEFEYPKAIATSRTGDVYVVDTQNFRVQRFGPTGDFRGKWGSEGTGDGQFRFPNGVAVDSEGSVYVIDFLNTNVQKFTASGGFVARWTQFGESSNDRLNGPTAIAVGLQGDVYVATEHDGMFRVTRNGTLVSRWGGSSVFADPAPGTLDNPGGIAVDVEGAVYVSERDGDNISKFSPSGQFISSWGGTGSGDGQFAGPSGIALPPSGGLVVADGANHRIQEFTTAGVFASKFGSRGSTPAQFNFPRGLATDCRSRIYVVDESNQRILVFGDAATGPPPCASSPGSRLVLAAAASKFRATMTTSTVKRGVRGASAAGVTERGIVARGRFNGQLAGKRKMAVLAPFTGGGTWRTSFDVTANIATKKGTARGYTLATARRKRRGQVCLKFDTRFEVVRGKVRVTGKFRSVGGTRGGAKLIASGKFTQAYKADKSFTMNGSGRAREGKPRRMPAACRRLARLR